MLLSTSCTARCAINCLASAATANSNQVTLPYAGIFRIIAFVHA